MVTGEILAVLVGVCIGYIFFFFQAEDGIRDIGVTGVQTCALPISGWKRKGWRKGDGKPVMNVDLLQEIDDAIAGRSYRFEWVKGHVGHVLNEAADEIGRASCRERV